MHATLRARTRRAHEAAEQAMNLPCRVTSLEAYGELLIRLWSLHSAFEFELGKFAWAPVGIDFDSRKRAHWLADDISYLGLTRCQPRALAHSIDTTGAGIGVLYVLEGSTLGGQAILQQATRLPGISATQGARFFCGHATKTGSMWRAFIETLDRVDPISAEASIIEEAALRTFDEFINCIRE